MEKTDVLARRRAGERPPLPFLKSHHFIRSFSADRKLRMLIKSQRNVCRFKFSGSFTDTLDVCEEGRRDLSSVVLQITAD